MGTRILHWVFFLFTGRLTDAGVTQVPKYLITETGQQVTLTCGPISGHVALYWYQQITGKGIEMLVNFQNNKALDDTRLPKERFIVEWLKESPSTLTIKSTEFGDSAVYLCASSSTTAL
uniref:Ig-like domain-containing protein n=1 Tax=Monodelphis domestica TaxID=13616 RepID=F6RJM4_MONDO